jgi:arsenate reductase
MQRSPVQGVGDERGRSMADTDKTTIYHNPRCSKSRAALAILTGHGIDPVVIEYLKTPPTSSDLRSILDKLGMRPAQLVRKSEDLYKAKFSNRTMNDEEWLKALVKHPVLIERPIVIRGNRAIIGRPPEKVEELL